MLQNNFLRDISVYLLQDWNSIKACFCNHITCSTTGCVAVSMCGTDHRSCGTTELCATLDDLERSMESFKTNTQYVKICPFWQGRRVQVLALVYRDQIVMLSAYQQIDSVCKPFAKWEIKNHGITCLYDFPEEEVALLNESVTKAGLILNKSGYNGIFSIQGVMTLKNGFQVTGVESKVSAMAVDFWRQLSLYDAFLKAGLLTLDQFHISAESIKDHGVTESFALLKSSSWPYFKENLIGWQWPCHFFTFHDEEWSHCEMGDLSGVDASIVYDRLSFEYSGLQKIALSASALEKHIIDIHRLATASDGNSMAVYSTLEFHASLPSRIASSNARIKCTHKT
eukprot:CAMPEP_0183789894 /NCGR_PEP_ID=MMETSP0803_2-20130417/696_1 /TAXON_ID=195967 /ORGANISM="Crustomastix stigmata, Strain CCMP3273" /LENGTH=339 /DNA_ID=CAMNT_0026034077 /DNA_START=533 /DNA_END=1552 /DNA_ORIENTATION=+